MPQEKLLSLLEGIGEGIGMDASIRQSTKYPDFKLVATTDFFYPLVYDPELQGRIGAANVLSDMYAMGVSNVDSMLMILAVSLEMETKAQDIVTRLLIKGFSDTCKEAGLDVSGGQTVKNPWPIVGGVAQSICKDSDFIMPVNAKAGDLLVLTKPLGTQVAVNMFQWYKQQTRQWTEDLEGKFTAEDAALAFDKACESMARLNKNGAALMVKHNVHAATDVTGFGLLGHAQNLAENQEAKVNFIFDKLPIIKNMVEVDAMLGKMFKIREGWSAETSGGLLACIPAENAQTFIDEVMAADGQPAWIVGRVVEGNNSVEFAEGLQVIEV